MATAEQTITLPSRGVLYEGRVPDGKVVIRKMTAAEEAVLSSAGGTFIDRISRIIAACAKLPNAFAHKDLLVTDRLAILIALRTFTFGPNYACKFTCGDCRAKNDVTVNIIDELKTVYAGETLAEPIHVNLVDAGVTAQMRFMRGTDEEAMAKYAKRFEMRSSDQLDQSQIHRVARLLLTIDGEELGDIVKREDYIRALTAADLIRIENAIDDAEPGIDLELGYTCLRCDTVQKERMPFTAEFFRPARV